MLKQSFAAYRGHRLWARLERTYKLDDGAYVLLMPEEDDELNAAALRHLEALVADRHARGIVLVAEGSPSGRSLPDSDELAGAFQSGPGVIGTELWTAREIDSLIAYMELGSFSDRLLIVSLTKPFGNGLHRLLDRRGVTKEDLVCLGCLRLRSYGMVKA